MNKLENLKKKILYRSTYRGTKELDLLLSSFVKKYLNKLGKNELIELEKFLDLEDEKIMNFYQFNKKDNDIKNNYIAKLFKEFKL